MRFQVSRASQPSDLGAPCEGATREDYTDRWGKHTNWYVEIADLPALMAFIAVNGSVVVSADEPVGPFLTIYDDYLE